MSTALYRRYRPDTFADVIGQEHVTEPLVAAIDSGRINHAYLFSGPRGCGKTTSARIFARCLNCAQGPTGSPCGTCESCIELARGGSGSLDVVELDAASHGGVDDARDLRERAIFAPARDRYKIFIIDEAHMVTPQGFNALLKLVEEPPEHVKFVFATTEPEKVIGTIRSRTHHYPFRLVPPDRLSGYLGELSAAEKIQLEDGVIPLVVRAGGGSVRDSLSVLDQLMAGAIDGVVSYQRAVALLGYTPEGLLDDAVAALAAHDGAGLFGVVDQVISSGQDPRRFTEDLLERFRDLIVVLAAGQSDHAVLPHVPVDQLQRMRAQASHLGAAQCSRAADLVHEALDQMAGATSPRLQLELLCARLLLPSADEGMRALAVRLDRIEAGVPLGGGLAGQSGAAAPSAGGKPAAGGAAQAAPRVQPVPQQPVQAPPSPSRDDRGAAAPTDSASPGQAAVSAWAAAAKAHSGKAESSAPAERGAPQDAASAAPTQSTPPRANSGAPQDAPSVAPTQSTSPRASSGAPQAAQVAQDDDGWPSVSLPGRGVPAPAEVEPSESARREPDASAGQSAAPDQRQALGHPEPAATPAPDEDPAQESGGAGQGLTVQQLRNRWPEVLQQLARIRRVTWTLVSQDAQVVDLQSDVFTVGFSTAGLASAFQSTGHAGALAAAFQEALGLTVRIETTIVGATGRGGASAQPVPSTPPPRQAPVAPRRPAEAPTAARPDAQTSAVTQPGAPAPTQPAGHRGPASEADPASPPRSASENSDSVGQTVPTRADGSAEPSAPVERAGRSESAAPPSAQETPPWDPAPTPSGPPDWEADLPRSEPPDDYDDYSPDDADVSGSDLVGAPLLVKTLGATVIDEIVEG